MAAATVTVDDIDGMSDAELGMFMKKHRGPNGGFELPVDGWEKLSKDDRNRLAERLKAQGRGSPTASSHPLDLDDLDARLRQVSRSGGPSLQPELNVRERAEAPTPPFDMDELMTRHEIWAYHELVNDGGRPLYPAELIMEFYKNPENYAEILRPWQINITPISAACIFVKQLDRWQNFRKWQNDNRGLEEEDGGFPAYLERMKDFVKREYLKEAVAERLAEIEADPSSLKPTWEHEQGMRRRQRHLYREHGCDGFQDYTAAVRRRLARHDFTQPFELDEDPTKQGPLATWIEYLNYEYWWLDKHVRAIEHLDPEHDKAWQELVDMKILRPHETKEFVRTQESALERYSDKDQAMQALQRAEAQLKRIKQETPDRLRIPEAERISMLEAGSAKVLAAKGRLEQMRTRAYLIIQFVRGTFGWDGARQDASCQRVLAQWVLEQVPLVQAEMAQSEASRVISPAPSGTKRKRTSSAEPAGTKHPKRLRRLDAEDPDQLTSIKANAIPNANTTQPKLGDAGPTPEGPRRSARLAARQSAAKVALSPDTRHPRPRSKPTAKVAQHPPRPALPAMGTKSWTGVKGDVQSVGRRGVSKSAPERPQRRRRRGHDG